MFPETLAIHAGRERDLATGAVVPPIHLSVTYEREPDGTYPRGYVYSSRDNPNRAELERALCQLEGGAAALAFASGSAAAAVLLLTLGPGSHVVAPDDVFQGTARLLRDVFAPWGVACSFVDMADLDQVRRALRPETRLIWVETPSNPLLRVTDLAGVAALARAAGIPTVCDGTITTPVVQRPLDLGFDLVAHATTKYLGGHGDLVGGALIAAAETPLVARLRELQFATGAVPAPFDCWLLLRGLRTLPQRLRAQCDGALRVARFLAGHPGVATVYYPGLETHPGHAIAARQMTGFGGLLSFRASGGRAAAMAVAANVRLFTRATSMGTTESLIEHRASSPIQTIGRGAATVPDDLLRVSIGLEHADDLIADLARALAAAGA